ncbi:hypothetical protein BAE44_0005066 [Dichanthelium oligosanthes]|uniref:RNase H type-1 domain-containing protein n=1 Tax=Dichanthelium oligosanthes TaxID=888268 RepID=A0A1E5W984_9POAL|nr:hypothetical protein BAE44_0005066 [Dichanthelium oligosanthes]
MRPPLAIADESLFEFSGPNWLLLLLERCFPEHQHLTKLVLWRAWSVHNNVRHQSGPTQLVDSVHFLLNIPDSLKQSQEQDVVVSSNEHCMASDNRTGGRTSDQLLLQQVEWTPPLEGWTKVNVDGSFLDQTGTAGVGVIARTLKGDSWSIIQVKRECNSIAHDLAHLARCNADSAVWLGRAPACYRIFFAKCYLLQKCGFQNFL